MVVEDSTVVQMKLEVNLKNNGYMNLLQSYTLKDAYEQLSENEPDIFFIDLSLPDGNGLDFIREIRSYPSFSHTPIIVITSDEMDQDIAECFEAGADDYIHKPWKKLELLARLKMHLEHYQSINEREKLIIDLGQALKQVKQLSGLIPICAVCKNVRNDSGFWQNVEEYLGKHSDASFSHGICPCCLQSHYPEEYKTLKENGEI